MTLLIILITGAAGIFLGRLLMKQWFNHLTIYSLFWTLSLATYTFRLIEYYQILPEAWFFIGLSWCMLFLGTFAVVFAHRAIVPSKNPSESMEKPTARYSTNLKWLSGIIIVLSILSVIGIILKLISVIQTFGSLTAALVQAHVLYRMRVAGEFLSVPYLGSFPLAASCLAGLYTALRRKLTFLSFLPFILVGLHGIVVMGRTDIMIAGALFLTSLFYTPHKRFISRRTILALVLMTTLTLGTFTLISSIRGLTAYFKHESQEMTELRSTIIFLPSIYFYLSAPPVAFSEYLYLNKEKVSPGSYTLKSVYNILKKMDLAETLPTYNPFILTPEAINAGTYLREIHADFGPVGVLIFPYILGVLLTMVCLRVRYHPTAFWIVILAHLSVIIWLSWDINAMKLGQWTVSIFLSILIALRLDSFSSTHFPKDS